MMKKASIRARSKSRGRSPGRPKAAAAKKEEAPAAEDKVDAVEKAVKKTTTKALKAETPTRTSTRIKAKAISEGFSDDEEPKVKLAPNPELPDARGRKKGWSFEWVWALVFMVLGPVILVSLHTLCTKSACKLQMPVLSTAVADYLNQEAVTIVIGFSFLLTLASYIPVGATVNGH